MQFFSKKIKNYVSNLVKKCNAIMIHFLKIVELASNNLTFMFHFILCLLKKCFNRNCPKIECLKSFKLQGLLSVRSFTLTEKRNPFSIVHFLPIVVVVWACLRKLRRFDHRIMRENTNAHSSNISSCFASQFKNLTFENVKFFSWLQWLLTGSLKCQLKPSTA